MKKLLRFVLVGTRAIFNVRSTAVSVVATFMFTQVLFAQTPEKSFWESRKAVAQRTVSTRETSNPLLAQLALPATGSPLVTKATDFSGVALSRLGVSNPSPALSRLVSAVSANGVVRDVYPADPSKPLYLYVQDVHGLQPAQENIHAILSKTLEAFPNAQVGLEGASGPIDLKPLRSASLEANTEVGHFFFNTGCITGAELAAFTAPKDPVYFGLEQKELYDAHVAAVKRALPTQDARLADLARWETKLSAEKKSVFTPALLSLDQTITGRRKGTVSLQDYLTALGSAFPSPSGSLTSYPNTTRFLSLLKTERSINFQRAEESRNRFLEKLVSKMGAEEVKILVDKSAAFRTGSIPYGAFYEDLLTAGKHHGIAVNEYPEFRDYVTYVNSADRVSPEGLLKESLLLEEAVWEKLAQTPAQKRVRALSRDLAWADKLIRLSMTPDEWKLYQQKIQSGVRTLDERFASKLSVTPEKSPIVVIPAKAGIQPSDLGSSEWSTQLKDFESFYDLALARDGALASHVLTHNPVPTPSLTILVAGGFHSEGLTRALKAHGTVVTVAPKMDKVDLNQASDYLKIFTRAKLPLDQMFESPKISLGATPAIAKTAVPATASALEAAASDPASERSVVQSSDGPVIFLAGTKEILLDHIKKMFPNSTVLLSGNGLKKYFALIRKNSGKPSSTVLLKDPLVEGLFQSLFFAVFPILFLMMGGVDSPLAFVFVPLIQTLGYSFSQKNLMRRSGHTTGDPMAIGSKLTFSYLAGVIVVDALFATSGFSLLVPHDFLEVGIQGFLANFSVHSLANALETRPNAYASGSDQNETTLGNDALTQCLADVRGDFSEDSNDVVRVFGQMDLNFLSERRKILSSQKMGFGSQQSGRVLVFYAKGGRRLLPTLGHSSGLVDGGRCLLQVEAEEKLKDQWEEDLLYLDREDGYWFSLEKITEGPGRSAYIQLKFNPGPRPQEAINPNFIPSRVHQESFLIRKSLSEFRETNRYHITVVPLDEESHHFLGTYEANDSMTAHSATIYETSSDEPVALIIGNVANAQDIKTTTSRAISGYPLADQGRLLLRITKSPQMTQQAVDTIEEDINGLFPVDLPKGTVEFLGIENLEKVIVVKLRFTSSTPTAERETNTVDNPHSVALQLKRVMVNPQYRRRKGDTGSWFGSKWYKQNLAWAETPVSLLGGYALAHWVAPFVVSFLASFLGLNVDVVAVQVALSGLLSAVVFWAPHLLLARTPVGNPDSWKSQVVLWLSAGTAVVGAVLAVPISVGIGWVFFGVVFAVALTRVHWFINPSAESSVNNTTSNFAEDGSSARTGITNLPMIIGANPIDRSQKNSGESSADFAKDKLAGILTELRSHLTPTEQRNLDWYRDQMNQALVAIKNNRMVEVPQDILYGLEQLWIHSEENNKRWAFSSLLSWSLGLSEFKYTPTYIKDEITRAGLGAVFRNSDKDTEMLRKQILFFVFNRGEQTETQRWTQFEIVDMFLNNFLPASNLRVVEALIEIGNAPTIAEFDIVNPGLREIAGNNFFFSQAFLFQLDLVEFSGGQFRIAPDFVHFLELKEKRKGFFSSPLRTTNQLKVFTGSWFGSEWYKRNLAWAETPVSLLGGYALAQWMAPFVVSFLASFLGLNVDVVAVQVALSGLLSAVVFWAPHLLLARTPVGNPDSWKSPVVLWLSAGTAVVGAVLAVPISVGVGWVFFGVIFAVALTRVHWFVNPSAESPVLAVASQAKLLDVSEEMVTRARQQVTRISENPDSQDPRVQEIIVAVGPLLKMSQTFDVNTLDPSKRSGIAFLAQMDAIDQTAKDTDLSPDTKKIKLVAEAKSLRYLGIIGGMGSQVGEKWVESAEEFLRQIGDKLEIDLMKESEGFYSEHKSQEPFLDVELNKTTVTEAQLAVLGLQADSIQGIYANGLTDEDPRVQAATVLEIMRDLRQKKKNPILWRVAAENESVPTPYGVASDLVALLRNSPMAREFANTPDLLLKEIRSRVVVIQSDSITLEKMNESIAPWIGLGTRPQDVQSVLRSATEKGLKKDTFGDRFIPLLQNFIEMIERFNRLARVYGSQA